MSDIHFENEPEMPSEMQEHLLKAVAHHRGHEPEHPGMYTGPQMLVEEKLREIGPGQSAPPPGPLPPQEVVEQPQQQKKGKPPAQPHGQTPAAAGAAAVQPEQPEGNF